MGRKIEIRLGEVLNKREITQAQLNKLTGIRQAAISQLARGFVTRISIDHIERIADALEIDDINELITFNKK